MATTDLGWLLEARRALGLGQRELADVLQSSLRTVQRMHAGRASPSRDQYVRLIRATYPVDPALAAGIAGWIQTNLEALGVKPPAPAPASALSAPEAPPVVGEAIDSVICAAGDAVELPLSTVRVILTAAFVRARELGLSVEVAAVSLLAAKQP